MANVPSRGIVVDMPEQLAAPKVRSLDDVAHNLPVQLTSFIARDAEMTQVRSLLAASRLVTLTGAGGVGKTRLALEVAAGLITEFPAGVWQVDLSPLTDPTLVPVMVARALGLPDQQGVATMATVTGFISAGRTLVVLDNCEHMLSACAQLAEELLRACPALVILATSREPVCAAGEATWLVPSLAVDGAAIELFAARAQQARPGFAITPENGAAVAEICRRLDGMPLAIELAAARLRAMAPPEIAAGLNNRFRLLTGGSRTAVRRQQTLRASVDWSHALLTETERVVFRRLAAFGRGFELESAEAVVAGDGLDRRQVPNELVQLVDKSLVVAEESEPQGATRYRLPETIRQYAAEKLADSGEADTVRTRHRDHYTAMAARLDQPGDDDRRQLIRRLEADIDNIRAAAAWSMELSDPGTALQLASSLQPLWLGRFRQLEGLALFDAAMAGQAGAESVAPKVRVRALADAAVLDSWSDGPRRMVLAKEAVALARQVGDSALLGRALAAAGCASGWLVGDGGPYFSEADVLAREARDDWTLAQILGWRAFAACNSGDPVAARSAAEEGLALAGQTGNVLTSRQCRTWLCGALNMQGEVQLARSLISDLVAEATVDRDRFWECFGRAQLGVTLALTGQAEQARAAGEGSIAIANDLGVAIYASPGYDCLALAAMAAGDPKALREASQEGWQRMSARPELGLVHLNNMTQADLADGDFTVARQRADQIIATATALGMKYSLLFALLTSARIAIAAGDPMRPCDDAHQALAIARDIQSQSGIIDTFECLGGLAPGAEEELKAARLLGAADALRQRTGYQRFRLHQGSYDDTLRALRSAMGDAVFGQAWAEGAALALDDAVTYALRGRGVRGRPAVGWVSLTPTEREVARLIAEGLANKDIAARLFVSPRTVQSHLTHIYGKLGITSRVHLAQQAVRNS